MSGSLRVLPPGTPAQKHDHFDLVLGDRVLRLRDPRRFGAVLWTSESVDSHPLLAGLGVEPLSRAVSELDEALLQARSRVHSFDLGIFERAAAPAGEALAKARQSIDAGHADYRFRQRGLLAAIGSIGVLALAIALKLRELGRRRRGQ